MFDFLSFLKPSQNRLAQPMQPQSANMLAQPQGGGFMDKYRSFVDSDKGQTLNDLFTGWAMGSNAQDSLGKGAMMLNQGRQRRKDKEQANQTVEWLKSRGLDENQAKMIASQPGVLTDYLKQMMDPNAGLENEYKRAQIDNIQSQIKERNDPNARDKFGNSVIWGQNDAGDWVAMQPSSGGGLIPAEVPNGIKLSPPGLSSLNLGTQFGNRDRNGNIINTVPIDNAGEAAQKKMGESQGAAQFDLPRVEQNAMQSVGVLERMKTHPGREGSTGFIQGMLPSRTSDQVDFQSLVDQTQGQSFLQAFQMLKGAGQITEIEGQKATQAISRLGNQRLSDQDYLRAITDLEEVIQAGLERARRQAGQGGMQAPAGNADPLGIR